MKAFAQSTQALLGFRLTPSQLAALRAYERELLDWNTRYNLTAIRDPEQVRVKHFLDSLTCLMAMRLTPMDRVIDIGTGAGFPGLPLKIVHPGIKLTLVESVVKKASFCQHIVHTLELSGVEILRDRAEDLGQKRHYREQYDWAIARAVANLPVLVEYLLPLVRIGGRALAMKGESALVEAQSSEYAIHLLGGRLSRLIPVELPGVSDQRHLVVIDKIAATPDTYPRRAGLPAKKPLS